MFDKLQPGVNVKTPDGIGTIYRRDFATVIVMLRDNDTLFPQLYRFAEVEVMDSPIEDLEEAQDVTE